MQAKYKGWCKAGNHAIVPGQYIKRYGSGWAHTSEVKALDRTYEEQVEVAVDNAERDRDDYEYKQGLAEGRVYQAEKRIYGKPLADRFQAMDEWNRYWKNGEDY